MAVSSLLPKRSPPRLGGSAVHHRQRRKQEQATVRKWTTTMLVVAVGCAAAIGTTTNNNNNSFVIQSVESFVPHAVPVTVSSCSRRRTTEGSPSSTHSSHHDVVKVDLLRRSYRVNGDLEEEHLDSSTDSAVVDEEEQQTLMKAPKPPTTVPPPAVAAKTTTTTTTRGGVAPTEEEEVTTTALSGAAAYSYFAVEKNPATTTTTEADVDVDEQVTSASNLGDDNNNTRKRQKNKKKVGTTTTPSTSTTLINEIDDVLKDVADVLYEVNTKLDSTAATAAEAEDASSQQHEEEDEERNDIVNNFDVVGSTAEDQQETAASAAGAEEEDMTLTNVIQNYFAVAVDDDDDEDDDTNDGIDGSLSVESSTTQKQDLEEIDTSATDGEDDRDEYDDVLNSYLDDDEDDEDFDGEDHFEDDDSDEDDGVESPIKEDPIRDLTFAVRDAAVDGSLSLLKGLRYTAAAALSSTLPKKERKELMERIIAPASSSNTGSEMDESSSDESTGPGQGDAQMDDPLIDLRGSVQEEIALAVREVARRNEDLWQEERDVIATQLEDAANARVEAELKIQQQRLDHEKELWQKTELAVMRADLKEQITYLQEQLQQAEDAKEQVLGQNVSAAVEHAKEELIQQEAQKMEDLQRLLKKRQTQQEKLDAVEESLKQRAVQIKAEKEKVERLEQQQKLSSALSSFGNVQPGVISSAPQRKQYRAFTQHQKMQQQVSNSPQVSGGFVSSDQPEAQSTNVEHPLLGPLIADLGYKKIYLSSSIELGTIPIWSRQRTYRNDRARRMAADKSRSLHLGFPGAVCLYEDTDGSLSILDGQHRIGMMQILRDHRSKQREKRIQNGEVGSAEDETYAKYFDYVLVEVYTNNASSHQNNTAPPIKPDQVFLEINKAEPVQLVDMPGVAPTADRMVITEAVETLQHQFPKMFSPSQKCRVPNVNVDNLRNSIFGANVLRRLASKNRKKITSQHLIQWLLIQNARIGDKYESYFEENGKPMFVSQKAWEKASRNGFYLGLESSWLYSKK